MVKKFDDLFVRANFVHPIRHNRLRDWVLGKDRKLCAVHVLWYICRELKLRSEKPTYHAFHHLFAFDFSKAKWILSTHFLKQGGEAILKILTILFVPCLGRITKNFPCLDFPPSVSHWTECRLNAHLDEEAPSQPRLHYDRHLPRHSQ